MDFVSRLTNWAGAMWGRPSSQNQKPEETAPPLEANGWYATHVHKKGGRYRVIMHAVLETDRSDVVVYDDADGNVWVRPATEFYDGRFELLEGTSTR
ncbi:MAG: DUF1653 domain-containing protein [Pseudomonadota bacterium]